MSIQNVPVFNEQTAQLQSLDRQKRLAELLQGQSMAPIESSSYNGIQAPVNPMQGLAKMLQAYSARKMHEDADNKYLDLAKHSNQQLADGLANYQRTMQGTPEIPAPADELGGGPARPAVPGDRNAAFAQLLASPNSTLQQFGLSQMAAEPDRVAREQALHMSLADRQAGREQQNQQFLLAQENNRLAREQADQTRRDLAEQSRNLQKSMADQSNATRMTIAQMADAQRQQKNTPKLPTPALKLQQEELDAIGTSGGINADLGALAQQIDSGKLDLGPVSNLAAKARNFAGVSNENSRNLQSFQSTLEKLRNDSLRLNKGVQTEGDATRAWNELIANINDKNVVRQRLAEIQKINERATTLRKNNIDVIRSNFGLDGLDTTPYTNQAPAVGNSNIDALLNKYK